MTSKQRAQLRSMANTLQPLYQIGKAGVTPAVTEQLDAALEARELIKITVLETAPESPKDTIETLAARLHAEPVQCIGKKLTLYRRSKENPRIKLNQGMLTHAVKWRRWGTGDRSSLFTPSVSLRSPAPRKGEPFYALHNLSRSHAFGVFHIAKQYFTARKRNFILR